MKSSVRFPVNYKVTKLINLHARDNRSRDWEIIPLGLRVKVVLNSKSFLKMSSINIPYKSQRRNDSPGW